LHPPGERLPCTPRADRRASGARWNLSTTIAFYARLHRCNELEVDMGFGRGVLLWLIGVPIPIILLIALFWHH
jgi:hypothetical protein